MIAYDKTQLINQHVKQQLKLAVKSKLMDTASVDPILKEHPVKFYSPGWIARFGLYLATAFGISTSFGTCLMITVSGEFDSGRLFGLVTLLFGLGVMIFGDYFIRNNFHLRSGVDDAFLYGATSCIAGGLIQVLNASPATSFLIVAFLGVLGVLRYNDTVMVLVFLLGIAGFIFNMSTQIGGWAQSLLPFTFLIMYAVFFMVIRGLKKKGFDPYGESKMMGEAISLLLMYTSVNYFVVREASVALMGLQLPAGKDIPLGWLFWILTALFPVLCFYFGVRKKSIMFIRMALLFTAASIFSVRHYYSVMPAEIAMLLGGILLIGLGWWLMLYLKNGKSGFTSEKVDLDDEGVKQIESLIIAETFRSAPHMSSAERFGGGNFGGGGATDNY
jgi:hypothetical protein